MLVEWSDDARQDLDDLVHYISRDSVFYAGTFAERIVLATRKLGDFPRIGRQIPEAEQDAFREIIVQGYRVMYHLEPDRILILAIMHGSRDAGEPHNQPWTDE
ncbi:MAG: type II toxin-antitoxin system RelE/ParE family toxin [Alcanivoracaceae bacterium]